MATSASPRDRVSPKPWKNAKAKKQAAAPASIEIFEGKPTVPGHPVLESTPADRKSYLRILCDGDAEFFVPAKVVERFKCVDAILHGEADFKEKLENVIRFPDFRPEVLESVMRFVFIELIDSLKAEKYWGQNAPRVPFQFEVEPGQVMELVYAAHFFGISNLLSVAAAMIAHHMKDVPDVSSMPPDLAWCVAEQFSAQDLFDAEERDDFLSLKLDTTTLWEKHSRRLSHDCIVTSSEGFLHYEQWEVGEGPPPTSWKSLYVTMYFQQVADRQDGSTNKTLFDEAVSKGKWVYAHTVRPTFWEWVMTGERGLSFSTYAAQFPNLFSLCLAKVPLGSHFKGGCLDFGSILEGMPFLQLLDVSETGFTKEAAISLSRALKLQQRLQVLRVAYNCIMTEGYLAIVEVLPTARSLKLLDVRENSITMGLTKNAVESITASALEELYFDGNCRQRLKRHFTVCSGVPASLKGLYLQMCDLDDYLVKLLAEHALKDHPTIQRIDLSDNKITSRGASAIFRWMQVNTSLLELCLANNNITDACSPDLRLALCCHPFIQKVSLVGNYSYGEESIPEVISAAIQRGDLLLASKQRKFQLDIRGTDVSYANRARIQRQAANFVSLDILV